MTVPTVSRVHEFAQRQYDPKGSTGYTIYDRNWNVLAEPIELDGTKDPLASLYNRGEQ